MIKDFSYWIIPAYKNNNWDYEFLVINQKTYNGSFWWFPKWHAENWEDNITAAIRELEEEVWIKNIRIDLKKSGWFSYTFTTGNINTWVKWDNYDKTVKYWLWFVTNKEVKIQQEELNGYKRANYDDTLNILSHKNMKKIFVEITKWIA